MGSATPASPSFVKAVDILFSFLICLLATTAGGISGVGGGVIIKPVMDATSGLSVATISFLSGCTVLAMSFTSMVRSRGGEIRVEKRRGTPLAVGAAVGGILGKEIFEIVLQSGGNAVRIAQQVLMILLTLGALAWGWGCFPPSWGLAAGPSIWRCCIIFSPWIQKQRR